MKTDTVDPADLDLVKKFAGDLASTPADIVEYRWVVIERGAEDAYEFTLEGKKGARTIRIVPRLGVGSSRDVVFFRLGWDPEARVAVLRVSDGFTDWAREQRTLERIRERSARDGVPEAVSDVLDRVIH